MRIKFLYIFNYFRKVIEVISLYLVYPYKDVPQLYSNMHAQYIKMGLLVVGGYRRLYIVWQRLVLHRKYRRLGLYIGGSLAAGGFLPRPILHLNNSFFFVKIHKVNSFFLVWRYLRSDWGWENGISRQSRSLILILK